MMRRWRSKILICNGRRSILDRRPSVLLDKSCAISKLVWANGPSHPPPVSPEYSTTSISPFMERCISHQNEYVLVSPPG